MVEITFNINQHESDADWLRAARLLAAGDQAAFNAMDAEPLVTINVGPAPLEPPLAPAGLISSVLTAFNDTWLRARRLGQMVIGGDDKAATELVQMGEDNLTEIRRGED